LSRLEAKILLDERMRSINYNVDAIEDVVLLMELAQDKAELQRVIDHARNIPYAQGMASRVRLKDDPARQA
jgi:hypothetical protein